MSTLAEMLRETTTLEPAESEWLHLLAGDWQLIADLSFADLVLWVRGGLDGWRAVAHVRPNTGPMVFYDDIVGSSSSRSRAAMLDEAAKSHRLVAKSTPTFRDDIAIREDAVPVVHADRAIAVVTRHMNLTAGRTPSRLELTYRDLADSIMRMVAAGEFPSTSAPTGMRRGAPRVGDGVIHLDAEGVVKYASPNAVSAVHRTGHVGDVVGEVLAQIVADVAARGGGNVDESLAVVATGRAAWRSEVETESATITLRAIPLTIGGVRTGAMVLLRDVSELRRREQELLTKDATIREIHHRVKNNLQTVAALLRLQARRVTDDAAQAALEEAVRRVGTIALVHETLSQGFDETVNFDEIAVRGLRAVVEVATREHRVDSTFTGSFGRMRAEDATALAMIISELVQNAVEHGLADRDGTVVVSATRETLEDGEDQLTVVITDDGAGLPAGFRPVLAGLGTRIVTSLAADLRGRIRWSNNEPAGTRVEFVARLRPLSR
ncbi:PAS domain-containing sensor histidine kinase [Fodinibacter luteus]|uniref:histidine kinase n=1 Tax=Fodinibacter luteus TaxID=552064 RepID=A0ABP8KKT5_9MICO